MNVFFCDLRGVYDGNYENRDELIKKFVNLLEEICIKLSIEDLVFRFITTDNMDVLLPYIKELEGYTKDSIVRLTTQFASKQKYKDGVVENIPYNNKLDQMRYICKDRDVKRIFYADDTMMNQMMATNIMPMVCPDVEMISFIPGSDMENDSNTYYSSNLGLHGLIETLETYSNELEINLKKENSFCLHQ